MGSNIGKDQELISIVAQVVKEVAKVPVWAKLTPSTTDIVEEARGAFLGGADAISSSNTFPSLPLIDPGTLEFEMNVDGLVSSGGLGGPAILPQSMAKMSQLTQAFPDKAFSGIGGIALSLTRSTTSCSAAAPCRSARRDARPRDWTQRAQGADRRHAIDDGEHGWSTIEDFRGLRRDRVVAHSKIRRPDAKAYYGGYETEGYAAPRPHGRKPGSLIVAPTAAASDFVEVHEDLSGSPLWNPDLAPTPLARRTWSTYHIAALWIGMSVVITTYTLASGLMQQGMNWWQAMIRSCWATRSSCSR